MNDVFMGLGKAGQIFFNGKPVMPEKSRKIKNMSPDGFAWGYGGEGPSLTALAVLLEMTDHSVALELHQKFKWQFIACLPRGEDFILPADIVKDWIQRNLPELKYADKRKEASEDEK